MSDVWLEKDNHIVIGIDKKVSNKKSVDVIDWGWNMYSP